MYPMFDANKHGVETVPAGGNYYISIDYGTINPFSAGLWCVNGRIATRVKEYYFDSRKQRSQKTDEEYYEQIERLVRGVPLQYMVVDPSAASFIECVRRHGKFAVRKADNSVLDGIRNTSTMLNNGMLFFHTSCKDTIREFKAYRWDDAAKGDAVIKDNDHAMDDTRYFVQTVMRPNNRVNTWRGNV